MTSIDLNCDLGELPGQITGGTQHSLMRLVSSANVACGGHAGDAASMALTIQQARELGVAVGAHPGYEDAANFGRNELRLSRAEISDSVYRQVCALDAIANKFSVPIRHVKPHGALYNQAARDTAIAQAIADGVLRWRHDVVFVGLAGSLMLDVFRAAGFAVAAEAFADRCYEDDGSLRSRKLPGALLDSPAEAGAQVLQIVRERSVTSYSGKTVPIEAQTICLHGDNASALSFAAAIRDALRAANIECQPLAATPSR